MRLGLGHSLARRGFVATAIAAGPEAAYIAAITSAGATVSAPQQAAISAFMAGEIAAGRWDGHKRIYFPVWGDPEANAICMKSLTSGTFNGSINHSSKGVFVNASNGNMNTNTNLGSLGITKDSYHFALLLPNGPEENYSLPFSVNNFSSNSIYIIWNDGFSHLRIMDKVFESDVVLNSNGILTTGNDSFAGNLYFKHRRLDGSTVVDTINGGVLNAFPSNNLFILGESDGSISMNYPIGAFSASTELSSAQDAAYTLSLHNLYNRIQFGYITGLDWQNYADETIAYVIELNKRGLVYA